MFEPPSGPARRPISRGSYRDTEVVYRRDVLLLQVTREDASDAVRRFVQESLPEGSELTAGGPVSSGWFLIALPGETDALSVLLDIEDHLPEYVDEVALDVVGHGSAGYLQAPNDPRLAEQWGVDAANVRQAWKYETGTPGVMIAVLDSGINLAGNGNNEHPDLTGNRYVVGGNYADSPPGASYPMLDDVGHGSHVLGIVAATTNNSVGVAGVNWVSPIWIARVMKAVGDGGIYMTSHDFAQAVAGAIAETKKTGSRLIVNLSGGFPSGTPFLSLIRSACQDVHKAGGLLVAAAGNKEPNDPLGPIDYPARYSLQKDVTVIAVGALQTASGGASGYVVDDISRGGNELSVVAPGHDILSTIPPDVYAEGTGTSMATPFVTGIASLVWSRHPQLTAQEVKECIIESAIPMVEGAKSDPSWGRGRVDAVGALCYPLAGCCPLKLRLPWYKGTVGAARN